jgi:translation initiation factor 2B subunit (eIF-2B alpha/beta/delta family)
VRLDGHVYTSYGFTDREATQFSVAEQADCHDVGRDAEGSVFLDDPTQVTVWSFESYATEKVLGVRFDRDSFAVFVADSVPRDQADRILEELSQSQP